MLYLLQAFAETGLERWKGGWRKALIQLVNISTASPTSSQLTRTAAMRNCVALQIRHQPPR